MSELSHFLYKVLKLWWGDPKTRLPTTITIAGLPLIISPWWQPLVVAVLPQWLEIDSRVFENSEITMVISGWLLTGIGIVLYIYRTYQADGLVNGRAVIGLDFSKEDQRNEWMVYEVAFLWHGKEPPGIQAHVLQMTRDIEETKDLLHKAINEGKLAIVRQVQIGQGLTRWVNRDDLINFAKTIGARPAFLFPEVR